VANQKLALIFHNTPVSFLALFEIFLLLPASRNIPEHREQALPAVYSNLPQICFHPEECPAFHSPLPLAIRMKEIKHLAPFFERESQRRAAA
jgi:hypothetical protein